MAMRERRSQTSPKRSRRRAVVDRSLSQVTMTARPPSRHAASTPAISFRIASYIETGLMLITPAMTNARSPIVNAA